MGYVTGGGTSGSGGAVSTVAGRTGDVVLTAADVGAGQLPSGVLLPTAVAIPSGADVSGILGTSGSKAAAGNDARLSDARTPAAHKTSHATGGSDALTAADVGATTAAAALSAAKAASLDQFATPAADVAWGSHKITGLTNGSGAQDATAFGQLSVISPDRVEANAPLFTNINSTPTGVKLPTLLKPIFYPVNVYGLRSLTLANFGMKIQTSNAAQTAGLAIYSIVWASAGNYTATLVAQLNAAMSTASAVVLTGAVTTGAAGSGATTATLDFTANRYVVGAMQSEVTTSALLGSSFAAGWAGLGILSWTAAARSSTTDWPGSFTQSSGVAISGATAVPIIELVTATGAFFL